jgi:hypothetical protein
LAQGGVLQKSIVHRFDTEAEAYEFEQEYIDTLGRDVLTNGRNGGGGKFKDEGDTVTIRINTPTPNGLRLIRSLTPLERTIALVEAARKKLAPVELTEEEQRMYETHIIP